MVIAGLIRQSNSLVSSPSCFWRLYILTTRGKVGLFSQGAFGAGVMTNADNTPTAATVNGAPNQWWWWSQIPRPLQKFVAIVSCLIVLFPLTVTLINMGATSFPSILAIKNSVWPSPPPPLRADIPPSPTQQPTPRPTEPGVFEGYVYYEVGKDGKPTNDGQLKPASGGAMPPFGAIHVGYKLKAISPVNIRANPNPYNNWNNTGFNTVLGILDGGQCVQVVEGALRTYPVTVAASGGFLPVIRAACN